MKRGNKKALSTLIVILSMSIISLILIGVLGIVFFNVINTQSDKIEENAPLYLFEGSPETITFKKSNSDPLFPIKSIPGLVSWWRFEDNSQDMINNNIGTCDSRNNQCPQYISESNKRKKSAEFDGNNDHLKVDDNLNLDIKGDEISISVWINPKQQTYDSSTAGGIIVNKESSYELAIRSTNYIQWALLGPTGDPRDPIKWQWHIVNSKVELNKWSHIVLSYKFPFAKTYLNNILVESFDVRTNPYYYNPFIKDSDLVLGIGARQHQTSIWRSFFNGQIDELMIFNKSLTPEEIELIYNLTKD